MSGREWWKRRAAAQTAVPRPIHRPQISISPSVPTAALLMGKAIAPCRAIPPSTPAPPPSASCGVAAKPLRPAREHGEKRDVSVAAPRRQP